MIRSNFKIILLLLGIILLSGCSSKDMAIGYNKTYCEEHGCDYSDAGICGDPYLIYKYKNEIHKYAYKGISCGENK